MAKKIFLSVLVLTCLSGLVAVVWFFVEPQPVQKIKLSVFANPKVLSESVKLRLWEEMRKQSVVWIGIDLKNPYHLEWIQEFAASSAQDSVHFSKILIHIEQGRPELSLPTTWSRLDFSRQQPELKKNLDEAQVGAPLLLVTEQKHSDPYSEDSFATYIRKKYSMLTISVTNFPRIRAQEPVVAYPCKTEIGKTSTSQIGCLILQRARSLYRKKMTTQAAEDRLGFLDQFGMSDYILGIHENL